MSATRAAKRAARRREVVHENPPALKLLLGIPAYRRQIDVGVAYQVMQMTAFSANQDELELMGLVDVDSCSIDYARNVLLTAAIERGADWILMLDADTFHTKPDDLYRMIMLAEDKGAAVVASPVRRRKRRDYNVVMKHEGREIRIPREKFAGLVLEVHRIGTAYMALNVPWFKEHWPDQPWFVTQQVPGPKPDKIGEDYSFCDGVISRGGLILADARFEPVHVGADDIVSLQ